MVPTNRKCLENIHPDAVGRGLDRIVGAKLTIIKITNEKKTKTILQRNKC